MYSLPDSHQMPACPEPKLMEPAVALFALAFATAVASWWIERRQSERRGNAKNTLIWEISELKREAARNNTPSTFAKAVKAQRAAAQKEKELAALMQDKAKTWEDKAAWGLSTAQVILLFSAVLLFWNKPVAQLPPGLAWPMSSFLAAPSKSWATYGLIAAGPWVGLCMRASNGIARVIFPARAPGSSSASKLGRSSTKQD